MRIAYIAHLSEVSGSGVALLETVKGLREHGIDGDLVLPGDGLLGERARYMGVMPIVIPNPETDMTSGGMAARVKLLAARLRYIGQLARHLRANGYTLAYVNSSASVFAGVAAWLAGVPIAWHIHETLDNQSRVTRAKVAVVRRLAAGLLYASESARLALPHPTGKPGMVALNAIKAQQLLAEGRARLGAPAPPEGEPVILMNGTFPRKAPDVLLAAVALLHERGVRARVIITGPPVHPPEFARHLDSIIASAGLAPYVEFTGVQPSLVPLYRQAWVYVSPSRNEGLPIAIVEAMACGVPVIATDVGDCALLLENGACGWVVPPDDSGALADALAQALTTPDTAAEKTRRGMTKIETTYGSPDFWDPLIKFLRNASHPRGK